MKAINPSKTYRLGEVWRNGWLPMKGYRTCIRYFDKGIIAPRRLQMELSHIRYLSGQEVLDFVGGGIPLEGDEESGDKEIRPVVEQEDKGNRSL